MKKCPECGNPSYDGAPVCGNCGYKFPRPKMAPSKREDIFQNEDKSKKSSNDDSTLNIIKKHKILIGAILLITIIAICGIVLTGSNNIDSTTIATDDSIDYSAGNFSFKYPETWKELNMSDSEREDAKFFETEDGTVVEFYNVTSDFSSLKELTQNRISYAQENGDYVDLIETTDFNGVTSSNVILEDANGNYTRFVSVLDDGVLNVFKITGTSKAAVTSEGIETMLNSIKIA